MRRLRNEFLSRSLSRSRLDENTFDSLFGVLITFTGARATRPEGLADRDTCADSTRFLKGRDSGPGTAEAGTLTLREVQGGTGSDIPATTSSKWVFGSEPGAMSVGRKRCLDGLAGKEIPI
jgi:hypothetical protein